MDSCNFISFHFTWQLPAAALITFRWIRNPIRNWFTRLQQHQVLNEVVNTVGKKTEIGQQNILFNGALQP